MPRLTKRPPKLRRHKKGYGVVTYGRIDHYMGRWPHAGRAPKAVQEAYRRFIAEYWARGEAPPLPKKEEATVDDVIAQFWTWAKGYYQKWGKPTSELGNIRDAMRSLRELYGSTPASEFGPLKLDTVRNHIMRTQSHLGRQTVNRRIERIKRMFRWAKNNEIIPGRVYDSIRDLDGLKKGRTDLHESQPVRPVPDAVVEATRPFLPRTVADMVRFQRFTGCRPGEACTIRPCDVDRSSDVWAYYPQSHKAEHHEKDRVVFIGPKAQAVLAPYLLRDSKSFCFSPREQRKKQFGEARKHVKNPRRDRRRRGAHRGLNAHYTPNSYRVAIYRAIKKANAARGEEEKVIYQWSPNQLRHTAATEIRERFGSIDAAQVVLGHSRLSTTQIYAEKNLKAAREAMRKIG